MYLPCADCMNSSLPLRRCRAKIWPRRVNVNVLTSLLGRDQRITCSSYPFEL